MKILLRIGTFVLLMVAHAPNGVGGVAVGSWGKGGWHCVFSINRKQYAKQQQQLNLRIFCQFSVLSSSG